MKISFNNFVFEEIKNNEKFSIFKSLDIPDVLVIKPKQYYDNRGYFMETFNEKFLNIDNFVQDNQSFSKKNVLRGMHYQINNPQAKLIRVPYGKIYDVVIDLRPNSPTFLKSIGVFLDDNHNYQLYVPKGFAHGFKAITDSVVNYKVSTYQDKQNERTIHYSMINHWVGDMKNIIISEKDFNAPLYTKND